MRNVPREIISTHVLAFSQADDQAYERASEPFPKRTFHFQKKPNPHPGTGDMRNVTCARSWRDDEVCIKIYKCALHTKIK